jgi:hypothetical protein
MMLTAIAINHFMKQKKYLLGCVGILIFVCCNVVTAQTESAKSSSSSATPSATAAASGKQTARPLPFHGMVSGVDQKAKTFTISGKAKSRAFKVTDKTIITKGANTATMKDISENGEISGSYWKNADGSCEAKFVKLGPAAKKASGSPSPSPSPKPKS